MPFDQHDSYGNVSGFLREVVQPAGDEVLAKLERAHAWLRDNPERWHKGSLFGTPDGEKLFSVTHADLVNAKACGWGALWACDRDWHLGEEAKAYLDRASPFHSVNIFNDEPKTTLADILKVYRRAISARRAALGG